MTRTRHGRTRFVYLGSTRRTGSTMLAELLSFPPHSFVFREPRLPKGQLRLKPETPQLLAETGLDVMQLSKEMRALDPEPAVEHFRDTIKTAATTLEVIGVK